MSQIKNGRRGGLTMLALAAVVAGVVLVVAGVLSQRGAPAPARSSGTTDPVAAAGSKDPASGGSSNKASGSSSGRAAANAPPSRPDNGPKPLGPSRPVRLKIPAIGVRTGVPPIGLTRNGALAVPQPGPNLNKAAWFKNSPTPGQPGPSIIEGHVDTEQGRSVFWDLNKIRPGNKILVTRADGTRLTFTVDGVRIYKKSNFPTKVVYGASDLGRPALRVITCAQFDPSIGHYTGNQVVFASLTSTRRAG